MAESSAFLIAFIMAFVGVIVGLAIFDGAISDNVALTTQTINAVNQTVTAPAANATISLNGQAVSNLVAINATDGVVISSTNYTITNYQVVNGQLVARLTALDGQFAGKGWNLTYTYEPQGYITSSGGRSMVGLILIFAALAIAVVALSPILQQKLLDTLGR